MTVSQKFLFDTSFEPEDIAERASAIPLETHAAALKSEYAKGFERGCIETQAGIDARNTEQLQDLNVKLLTLLEEQAQYREKVQTLVAGILQKSLEKLFPVLAQEKGLEEVLQVVSEAFEQIPPGRELSVLAHPDTVESLQEKLNSLKESHSQSITFKVQADEGLSFSDCRITWEGGGLERLSARLYQEIDACFERLSVTETVEIESPQGQESSTPEAASETVEESEEIPRAEETEVIKAEVPEESETKETQDE